MKSTALIVATFLMGALVGCTPAEPAAANAETAPATTAALSKCAGCGKEVPAATLVSHDGQMLCKDCIAAHGH